MIDTHAHLYMCKQPLQSLIDNAQSAGITHIINVALNLKTAETCRKTYQKHPHVYPTIGLYPGEPYTDHTFQEIEEKAQAGLFVAIGEIGLDYFKMYTPKHHQRHAFISQLHIATALNMPVIIHNRHSESDMIEIMPQFPSIKKVFHCFGSHPDFITQVDSPNTYYSFTGTITFAKKGKTIQAIKMIPLEKIMLETDCPYLTPVLFKGEENQPAFIPEIAKRIAEIKNVSIETVIETTTRTAKDFFNIG